MGNRASYILFVLFLGILILKSQTTYMNKYKVTLLVGGEAFWAEFKVPYAVFCFNSVMCTLILANYIGVLDFGGNS